METCNTLPRRRVRRMEEQAGLYIFDDGGTGHLLSTSPADRPSIFECIKYIRFELSGDNRTVLFYCDWMRGPMARVSNHARRKEGGESDNRNNYLSRKRSLSRRNIAMYLRKTNRKHAERQAIRRMECSHKARKARQDRNAIW